MRHSRRQLTAPTLAVFAAVLTLCASLSICASLSAAEPYKYQFTSVSENVNPAAVTISRDEATPFCPTDWNVRKDRLAGGKQDGVDRITIDNGVLRIVVIPTRGMSIWEVWHGDVRIGWESPVKEIVHPRMVTLSARGGLGWLDGFGELMCRCGLESNGQPGPDEIVTNTGAIASTDLTLHGKLAYLPAQEVELQVDRDAPYAIHLRGRVDEHMVHGPKLTLYSELIVVPGESTFRLVDEVANESGSESEFQILYHTNFGTPLLEAGAEFVAPIERVTPFNERAAEGDVHEFATYTGPTAGYVEQVYLLRLYHDAEGQTIVMLRNASSDRGVSLRYDTTALPYLTVWKNTTSQLDGYVTGIEPGTNYPYGRQHEREAGRVPKLGPEERRRFEIEFAIHPSAASVTEALTQIQQIQGERATQYDVEPAE
ncbi:MAG: aldose 1-epimerase family protein [Pirellulales bacterium]